MVNDAARILKMAGQRGKKAVGYQGLYLATIKSVQPFKMAIDNVDSEYIEDDVLVNAQMLDCYYQGELSANKSYTSGQIDISGSASLGGYGGNLSVNKATSSMSGTTTLNDTTVKLKNIFKVNDRVAVSAIGMNKFLILCKVVNWQ